MVTEGGRTSWPLPVRRKKKKKTRRRGLELGISSKGFGKY